MDGELLKAVLATGCAACGTVAATAVEPAVDKAFRRWLAAGRQAGMQWLENHAPLRTHPRHVLEGVQTVICFAFRFVKPERGSLPVAAYALGRDYHKALKSRLRPFCVVLEGMYDCHTRICVDSAPVAERYWAVKSGIAAAGDNGMALAAGCGPYAFLAEVLTDAVCDIHFSQQPLSFCLHCGECVKACPTGALRKNGEVDANSCLSYLSIEHKGDLEYAGRVPFPLLGCDRCLSSCPLSEEAAATVIEDLAPREPFVNLTAQQLLSMTDAELDAFTAGSALRRAGMATLRRNARLRLNGASSKDNL